MDHATDARRGLGIRPDSVPLLKVYVDDAEPSIYPAVRNEPASQPQSALAQQRSPRSRDFSLPITYLQPGSIAPATSRSPSLGDLQTRLQRATHRPAKPKTTGRTAPKGLHESRKLLRHVLDRLESRNNPPDILGRAAVAAKRSVERSPREKHKTVRSLGQAVVIAAQPGLPLAQTGDRTNVFKPGISTAVASSDLDVRTDTDEWGSEATCDLVLRLRDFLLLAGRQGLDLLAFDSHGRSAATATDTPPNLRERTIRLLGSLMVGDLLYRSERYGPASPPLALHAASLDIATYLCRDAGLGGVCVQVCGIVVQSLYTAIPGVLDRTYAWIERCVSQLFSGTAGAPQEFSTSLLAALCATIDVDDGSIATISRSHRLLAAVLSAKPDAAIDLLEVVAFAPPRTRRTAMAILSTYYPHAVGHNVIARRLPQLTYASRAAKWETGSSRIYGEEATAEHHYVPWRISSKDFPGDPRGLTSCTVCEGEIHGFCIRCTLCGDVLHLDCYRESEGMFRYELANPANPADILGSVVIKFGRVQAPLADRLMEGTTRSSVPSTTHRHTGSHDLYSVHLFTVTLCWSCSKPIIPSSSGVFACFAGCQALFHATCLNAGIDDFPCQSRQLWPESRFAISFDDFSNASTTVNIKDLIVEPAQLQRYSYDEVAILYCALWMRYQMLKNGLQLRAVSIRPRLGETTGSDPLNLRATLRVYEEHLQRHAPNASTAATDFTDIVGIERPPSQDYSFSIQYLAYITSLMRSPAPRRSSDDLPPGATTDTYASGTMSSSNLASLRNVLADDLNVSHEPVVRTLLEHLHETGHIRLDREGADVPSLSERLVFFDLPRLADGPPAAELLVQGITACLEDLDLAMNEQGLMLLVERAWPSLLSTPYDLERLAGAAIRWAIWEESVLHQVVKVYASKQQRPPGLRSTGTAASSRTFGPVQLYQEARNGLLRRYVQPWLVALHEQDPAFYNHALFEQCYSEGPLTIGTLAPAQDGESNDIARVALDKMIGAVDHGITFGCLPDLLMMWLQDIGGSSEQTFVYKTLPRLIARLPTARSDPSIHFDLFSTLEEFSSTSSDDLIRVCRWVRVLAVSGVDVPWYLLRHLANAKGEPSVQARIDLAVAVYASPTSIDSGEFAELCGSMLKKFVSFEGQALLEAADLLASEYLTCLLLLNLRAYNPTSHDITITIFQSEYLRLNRESSARKTRQSSLTPTTKIKLDASVILAVVQLLRQQKYSVAILLDFLWLSFTRATAVANADELVYELASTLHQSIWPTLDLPLDMRCRTRLLLKLISVNLTPLEEILRANLEGAQRDITLERLLRLVLDLVDHEDTVDGRNWRLGTVNIIVLFLAAIMDPARSNPRTMAIRQAVLPIHMRTISTLFEEFLEASSDQRRLALLQSLRQIRLAFPGWSIISWASVDALLTECVTTIAQAAPNKTTEMAFAVLDAEAVRQQLVALGLDMLAAGITIPYTTAQRFQQHVAAICALPWSQPVADMVNIVLPALRNTLDSPAQVAVSATQSVDHKKRKVALVGSLFVPAAVDLGATLADKDVLTQRCTLDILLTIYHKQNTSPVLLSALNTLQNVAIFIEKSVCAENRILGLAVITVALDRVHKADLTRVVPSIFLCLASTSTQELQCHGTTSVTSHCDHISRQLIKTFGHAGLFINVLGLEGASLSTKGTGSVLGETIMRLYPASASDEDIVTSPKVALLLFNNLSDALKNGKQQLKYAISALSRASAVLLPVVHDEIIQCKSQCHRADALLTLKVFGIFIGKLGKHIAEWTAAEFQPDTILETCAILLARSSKAQATTVLSQMATFLHLCLSHFDVGSDVLLGLLREADAVCSRSQVSNVIRMVTNEIASSAIQRQAVTTVTLLTLLQHLAEARLKDPPAAATVSFDGQEGMRILLRQHITLHRAREPHVILDILAEAAKIVLTTERHQPGGLSSALEPTLNESTLLQLGVFTSVLMAAVDQACHDTVTISAILKLYPIIARTAAFGLLSVADQLVVQDIEGVGAAMLSALLVLVRLTLVLSTAAGQAGAEAAEAVVEVFWARISPEWSRLVYLSLESTCINKPLRAVTQSVFLDVILFSHQIQSPLLSDRSTGLESALDALVRHAERTGGAGSGGKLLRAGLAMKGDLPATSYDRSERDKVVQAVRADLVAMERMRLLRTANVTF